MSIILSVLISDKANFSSENNNKYVFLVKNKANKIQISNEVNKLFGVEVVKVRTMIYNPNIKLKYTKKRSQKGKTNKFKKAIIQVIEGQKIDIVQSK